MAGFFGLFNYEKEGPGIDKNAPKKKTFIVFFETFFRNFWKFITINLVYTLINLPIITNGLANVGVCNVARNTARDKHSFGLSDFFDTIKKNWAQALGAGIINIIIYAVLFFALWFYWGSEGILTTIGLGMTFAILIFFSIMNFYMWTLIITFKYKLKQVYKISFQFIFINLKNNLICGISLLLIDVLYFLGFFWSLSIPIVFVLILFLFVCTYPMFKALLIQFCTFPAIIKYIIEPYYRDRPDEDIELRRNLGLSVPGDDDDEEDEDESFENSEELPQTSSEESADL